MLVVVRRALLLVMMMLCLVVLWLMMVVAAVVLVMVKLVAVVVVVVSTTVVQAIMLFVVIGRSVQVCLLSHSLIGRGLSENFDVDVVYIQIEIVLLNFQFTVLKFCHQTVGTFCLTKTARNFIGVHPES